MEHAATVESLKLDHQRELEEVKQANAAKLSQATEGHQQ